MVMMTMSQTDHGFYDKRIAANLSKQNLADAYGGRLEQALSARHSSSFIMDHG
jgi:hypothetical protein